ncbi:hypothetical protein OAS39_04430 [Pirellulales bacterium]|nr:hypothetical protein [Pirellulales bacterium]
MNTREKRLVLAVAAAAAIWFGNRGLADYREAVDDNLDAQLEASETLVDAEIEFEIARRARRQLVQWRTESLPTNVNVARSLYQDWLREQFAESGLALKDLTDNSSGVGKEIVEVSFAANAGGSLQSLTNFLARFYGVKLLHRISASSISVAADGKQLDIQLTVDALVLPGCSRTDALPELPTDQGPDALEPLMADVVKRNVFAPYQPPEQQSTIEVAEKDAGPDKEAEAARVTGMTYGNGGWVVTVSTGESSTPRSYLEGDEFKIGRLQGRVGKIDSRRVIVETDEGQLEIRLGQTFAEAEPVAGRQI